MEYFIKEPDKEQHYVARSFTNLTVKVFDLSLKTAVKMGFGRISISLIHLWRKRKGYCQCFW